MKNDLTCGLVRDLLPSYVDGLLGPESQEAVDRHLADCPGCAATLAAMRAPEGEAGPKAEEQTREVDYLKRVKKRNAWKIVLAVACTAGALFAALLLKAFVIGTPFQPELMAAVGTVEGDTLHLSLMSVTSAHAFHSWRVEIKDGAASIYARDVLVSPLFSNGGGTVDVPLDGVREVWLGGPEGKLLWQDGMTISRLALDLMDAKTPYCGDPTAMARIAELLCLPVHFGSYTFSLQTSNRPYVCTIESANPLNDEQRRLADAYNMLALALVGNLEVSRFVCPGRDGRPETAGSVTLEEADGTLLPKMAAEYNAAHGTDWALKPSVKDYAQTPADLQRLLLILGSYHGLDLSLTVI